MTETTDIKALRPSERAKLGFVTDDNTGGYYVAECEECGQIFPSQTCEGGGQIADTGDYDDCYCPHCGFIDPLECDNANLVWNVQQLKIINLTNQLEAERQRLESAEAELAALRGTQEPVDTTMYMMPNVFASLVNTARDVALEYKNAQCLRDALSRELKGYFTLSHPPKPVVVLSDCTFEAVSHMAHWYTEGECVAFVSGVEHAKKQMQAAGIAVCGSDERLMKDMSGIVVKDGA
jgi:hypothetical protein